MTTDSVIKNQEPMMIVTVPPMGTGKNVIIAETLSTRETARILGLSLRRIQTMCEQGLLHCCQPGSEHGRYRILRSSVFAQLEPRP